MTFDLYEWTNDPPEPEPEKQIAPGDVVTLDRDGELVSLVERE